MFATFPNFSPLTLADRAEYEAHLNQYPPSSDLSFTTLMIWWNLANDLEIARLHGNLVLRYHLPSDPENSGLSLIGSKNMDQSITSLLDYLRDSKQPARLIHVPDFVVAAIKNPESFAIEEELDYAEYVYPTQRFYPLEAVETNRRRTVKRFLENVADRTLEVKELDLSVPQNARLLLDKIKCWDKDAYNDPNHNEIEALQQSFKVSGSLPLYNRCIFLDDDLCGFGIFQITHDGRYVIVNHMKGNRDFRHIYHFVEHTLGRAASEKKIPFVNMEMDLGIPGLRHHKVTMNPVSFFRKYSITYTTNL